MQTNRPGARALTALAVTLAGCGGGAASVPELGGDAVEVIVLSAWDDGTPAAAPIQLDSISFGRLGTVIAQAPLTAAELGSRTRRDIVAVDPDDVLVCPSRAPCRLRAGGAYITLWDAMLTGEILSVTVSRVTNVERLYTMTDHATWDLELTRTGSAWRLTARTRRR